MPIRRGLIFANAEGYYYCQSGGVLFLPIRRGLVFANPEGSCFCQSGGVLILPIQRGTNLLRLKWTVEKIIVKGIRLLRDRLGTSDCTGN